MRQIVLEEELGNDVDDDAQSDNEANMSTHTRQDIHEEAEDDDDDDDQDTERRESTVTIEEATREQNKLEDSDSDDDRVPAVSLSASSGLRGVSIKSTAATRPPIRVVRQEHPLKTEQTAGDSDDDEDDSDNDDDDDERD